MRDGVLLLTGFGVFPGVTDNPTAHVAQALDGAHVSPWRVHAVVLPVAWQRARDAVAAQVAARDPACIVHLGVATDAQRIRVEAQAANELKFRVADVDGEQPLDQVVAPNAPPVLATQLDCGSIAARLRDAGFAAEVSHDAGRYVCNSTYFTSLHAFAERPVLFVHVPDVSDAWSQEQILAAIVCVLRALP